MASSAAVRTGTSALTQELLSTRVVSTLGTLLPLVYFLFARNGDKKGYLGRGNQDVRSFISGVPDAAP